MPFRSERSIVVSSLIVVVRRIVLPCVAFALCAAASPAQSPPRAELPRIEKQDGRYALLVDGAPYLMLGAQINNSSAWPAMLQQVWPAIDDLHVNTVEMPIYWEQFEPAQGRFDDSLLLTLLAQARRHKVHLVLLWFGTWKNGSPHYTPEWVKLDNAKYPRAICSDGKVMD